MTKKELKEHLESIKRGDHLNERKELDYQEIVNRLEIQLVQMHGIAKIEPDNDIIAGAIQSQEIIMHYLYNMVGREKLQ